MRLIDKDKAIEISDGYCRFTNIPKELEKLPEIKAVPIFELENLHNKIGEIEYKTDREREILWTCQFMLLECIEEYKEIVR